MICLEPTKVGYKGATSASSEKAVLNRIRYLRQRSSQNEQNKSERFVKVGSSVLPQASVFGVRSIGGVQPIAQTYLPVD